MSDLHHLPLTGHDMPHKPLVRAKVFSTSPGHWYWCYLHQHRGGKLSSASLQHGPFASQGEAYSSAKRMVEAL